MAVKASITITSESETRLNALNAHLLSIADGDCVVIYPHGRPDTLRVEMTVSILDEIFSFYDDLIALSLIGVEDDEVIIGCERPTA